MPANDTIETLNRVLVRLTRSFTQYLHWARPYIPPGREKVIDTIDQVVAGQNTLADRIGRYVFESGGLPDAGQFPIEFTDTHDLGIDYLVQEAIGYQKQDIAKLEHCVEALRLAPAAQAFASEALGLAKGNLESLEELRIKPGTSTKIGATPAYANDMPVSAEISGTPHRQEERKLAAGDPHSPA